MGNTLTKAVGPAARGPGTGAAWWLLLHVGLGVGGTFPLPVAAQTPGSSSFLGAGVESLPAQPPWEPDGQRPLDVLPAENPAMIPLDSSPKLAEPILATASPVKVWEGSVELGSNGTDGNSQTFNIQFGGHFRRKTDASVLSLDATYNYNTSDSRMTANRLFAEQRHELQRQQFPWTVYAHGTEEFDEFRAFDVRLTFDAGVGRKFIATETHSLTGRVGAGFSQEIGGDDDAMVPEGLIGVSWERRFSDRHKVTASSEYFPDVGDFGDFRVNSQANWEIVLDEINHLSLKLGMIDRYDSTPGTARRNDLNYSAVVLWSF